MDRSLNKLTNTFSYLTPMLKNRSRFPVSYELEMEISLAFKALILRATTSHLAGNTNFLFYLLSKPDILKVLFVYLKNMETDRYRERSSIQWFTLLLSAIAKAETRLKLDLPSEWPGAMAHGLPGCT